MAPKRKVAVEKQNLKRKIEEIQDDDPNDVQKIFFVKFVNEEKQADELEKVKFGNLGKTKLGRENFEVKDKKVSRNQFNLTILHDLNGYEGFLTRTGINKSILIKFKNEKEIEMEKDKEYKIENGDKISLVFKKYWYKVELKTKNVVKRQKIEENENKPPLVKPNNKLLDIPKEVNPKKLKRTDSDFARELYAEEIKEAEQQLLKKNYDCPICLEDDYKKEDMIVLMSCGHETCATCMKTHFKVAIESNDFPLKCPLKCEIKDDFAHLELKSILDEEIFSKYEKFLNKKVIEKELKMRYCAYGCGNGWVWEYKDRTKMKCDTCDKYTCLKCNEKWHDNDGVDMSCEQYQQWKKDNAIGDDKFEEMIVKGKAMRCPNKDCQVPVQKDDGCDFIQCSQCQMGICWATRGPRWGPAGHGDKSGGCGCNVNGKMCKKP